MDHILSAAAERDSRSRQEVDRCAAQVLSALRSYPADMRPEERTELDTIGKLVARQREVLRSVTMPPREARGREGGLIMIGELAPMRIQILSASAQLQVWNRTALADAGRVTLAGLGDLQDQLTRRLVTALGSGFLLMVACTTYIVWLERQAQERYLDLSRSRGELQRLSARLVDAQETERQSISRELHDEVGQSLGALLVDLARLAGKVPSDRTDLQEEVRRMQGVAEQTVQTVRNMALLLRPSMLDDLGLAAALEVQGAGGFRPHRLGV